VPRLVSAALHKIHKLQDTRSATVYTQPHFTLAVAWLMLLIRLIMGPNRVSWTIQPACTLVCVRMHSNVPNCYALVQLSLESLQVQSEYQGRLDHCLLPREVRCSLLGWRAAER
jgi:hypothetical protein